MHWIKNSIPILSCGFHIVFAMVLNFPSFLFVSLKSLRICVWCTIWILGCCCWIHCSNISELNCTWDTIQTFSLEEYGVLHSQQDLSGFFSFFVQEPAILYHKLLLKSYWVSKVTCYVAWGLLSSSVLYWWIYFSNCLYVKVKSLSLRRKKLYNLNQSY